jgi:hypothetical protein
LQNMSGVPPQNQHINIEETEDCQRDVFARLV